MIFKPTGPRSPAATGRAIAQDALTVKDLDGPRGLPVLGNVLQFVKDGVPHRTLQAWTDEFGPTFRITLPIGDVVVTSAPAILHTVLRERPHTFRRNAGVSQLFDEAGAYGVFSAEGSDWRRLRRATMRSLNAAYVQNYLGTITEITGRLKSRWEVAAASGDQVNPLKDLSRYTLDVTAGLMLGQDLDADEARGTALRQGIPLLFIEFARRSGALVPYWRYLRLPRDRRLDTAVSRMRAALAQPIADARGRMAVEGAKATNFLEALIASTDGESGLTDDELFGNMLSMLVAGEDTTAATTSWAVHYLALNPQVQEKVRDEVDEVLGAQEFAPDLATLGRLTYASAVVDEALRLRPVAPFTAVDTLETVVLNDGETELRLEPGTPMFLLLTYGSDADADRFPEPAAFRPERWLDQSSAKAVAAPAYLPFGEGPRFCPGRNLALVEATLIVSMLCRNFVVEPDTSRGPVGERFAITAFPKNLRVRLKSR